MTVEIKHNDADVFVHKLRCQACGHSFRIYARRDVAPLQFAQFGVGCPACDAEVHDAAAGAVDMATVQQAFRLKVTWTGSPIEKRARLALQSRIDDEAEERGYFGTATVEHRAGRLAVTDSAVYLEDDAAYAGQRWIPAEEASAFVEGVMMAAPAVTPGPAPTSGNARLR